MSKDETKVIIENSKDNMTPQLLQTDLSYKKSNAFSMSKLNVGLTLVQTQLLSYAIFKTNQDTGISKFTRANYNNHFESDLQTKRIYHDSKILSDLKFSTEDLNNERFAFYNMFSSIVYDKGDFTFTWTNEMLPHIVDLKEKYIITDLTITKHFKNSYTWTLYEYLKANYGRWYITLSKKEIFNLFSVEDIPSYTKRISNFRTRVLNPAVEEINKHTELFVRYEPEMSGNRIIGFKLIWNRTPLENAATEKQRDIAKQSLYLLEERLIKLLPLIEDMEKMKTLRGFLVNVTDYTHKILEEDCSYIKAKELISLIKSNLESFEEAVSSKSYTATPNSPLYDWLNEMEENEDED